MLCEIAPGKGLEGHRLRAAAVAEPRLGCWNSKEEHPMEHSEAREFVSLHHRGVLVTRRRDGSPQLSPVLAAVDLQGNVVVSSRETAYKVQNLRRHPSASLCVVTDAWFGRWVQIDGHVEILSLPEAMEELVEYYRTVAGETDWVTYREAMVRERRVLIKIAIQRAGPDRSG